MGLVTGRGDSSWQPRLTKARLGDYARIDPHYRRHRLLTGPIRIEAVTSHGLKFVDALLGVVLDSRIQQGLFRRLRSVRANGNSADETLIVSEAFAEDNHSLGSDLIFANILGVIPTPHLDHHHNLAKLAIDGYVPKPDDVIGEERN
jgi:hypothetical protein